MSDQAWDVRSRNLLQIALVTGAALIALCGAAQGQSDIADIKSRDLRAGKDPKKRYFLIGPSSDEATPKE
ncbi:unnamed protein product, partial [marine sediment metagenome]